MRSIYTLKYFIRLVIIYIVASLLLPIDQATRNAYNLSVWQAHLLLLIAVIPLFGIWFAAFYCYGQLKNYASAIAKSREGLAFKRIADGVAWLSWGLVIQTFVALLLGAISYHHSGWHRAVLTIEEYITLLFPLIALPLISSGTHRLLAIKQVRTDFASTLVLRVLFATLAVIYTYLVLHLRHSGNPYALPEFLLLATLTVPYLFAWFAGLTAAFEMNLHADVTQGILYKRALKLLSSGLIVFVLSSILAQYLGSAFIANSGHFSLNAVLLFDYLLLGGIALGYILMIAGVNRLQRIEEI